MFSTPLLYVTYLVVRRLLIFLALLLAVVPAFSQVPIGYWSFAEGAGANAADSSGHGYTASLVNGISWSSGGPTGSAVAANAVSRQYVSIPPVTLNEAKAVSVALWVNRTYGWSGSGTLFEASSDYRNSTTGFTLLADDDECHGMRAALRGDVGYTANYYNQPSSGTWHHLVVIFDKTQTGGGELSLFIDGVQQSPTRSLQSTTNTNSFGDAPFFLFSRGGRSAFSSGMASDLRIYDRALSSSEVLQIYNSSGLVSLAISPKSASIAQGSQMHFTANGTYRDGGHRNITTAVIWAATPTTAASTSSTGVVTGTAAGNATVQARLGPINAVAALTITASMDQKVTQHLADPSEAPLAGTAQAMAGDVPGQAGSPITFVQGNYVNPDQPESAVNVTFTGAQMAGDLNVVVVGWGDSSAVVNTITDTNGNSYTRAVGPTIVTGQLSQAVYYAKNISAAAAGGNTVAVSFSRAAAYPDIRILEYRGADRINPVDTTGASTGSGTTSQSSVTTINPNDLIFGANIVGTLTTGPGTGFTQRILTHDGNLAEDRLVTQAGLYSVTAPLVSSSAWIMQAVAFRTGSTFALSANPAALSVAQGSYGSSTISSTVSGGFASAITLSASGLPAGTSVSFSPNPIAAPGAGTSTMTISVGSSTSVGTYPITVMGSGGGIQQTTTVTLTVTNAPDFTVTAVPTAVSVVQGGQGHATVTTAVSGGFASAITLSASGLPAGTSVSFSPNPIAAPGAGTSTMTISVGSSTSVGTYPIIVMGSGGGIQQTTTVTLTVTNAPDFSLTAVPTAVSVVQGGQGHATVTTAVSGGFASAITLSASGLPAGTSVSFSPNPIAAPGAGTSTMTISVGSSTPTGTYPITVTGVGGSIQHSTTVTLTVSLGTAQVALSWTASISQVVGYNAYRSLTSSGPYTKLNPALISTTTYTDSSVQHGYTYYYVTTAVDGSGIESVYSNQATAIVP